MVSLAKRLILPVSLVVYFAISLTFALTWSGWFDEGFTAEIIQHNPIQILHYTAVDVHPPLYYLLVGGWAAFWNFIFQGSIPILYVLRSFSILCGALTIVSVNILLKKLVQLNQTTLRTVNITTLFFSISAPFLRYSMEARMYSLQVLFLISATLILLIALDTKKRKYWIIYGVLVSAAMYTHTFSALIIVAHIAFYIYYQHSHRIPSQKWLVNKNVLLAFGVAVVLYLPWLPVTISQLTRIGNGNFWITQLTLDEINSFFAHTLLSMPNYYVVGSLAAIYVILMAIYLIPLTKILYYKKCKNDYNTLILSGIAIPVVFLLLFSLYSPSFIPRYLVISSVLLTIVVPTLLKSRKVLIVYLIASIISIGNLSYYQNYIDDKVLHPHGNKIGQLINSASQYPECAQMVNTNSVTPIVLPDVMDYFDMKLYETPEHPIRYLMDEVPFYDSMTMLFDEHKGGLFTEDELTNLAPYWVVVEGAPDEMDAFIEKHNITSTCKLTLQDKVSEQEKTIALGIW